jgi:hypothetical protein
MGIKPLLLLACLPALVMAQAAKDDPTRMELEITGCVKGATLTETSLRVERESHKLPERKWRLRGPKALMNQIKQHAGKELEIVGTTKTADPGMGTGGTRVGKTNIFIGGATPQTARDPLPEQPTLDVTSFKATGETCR